MLAYICEVLLQSHSYVVPLCTRAYLLVVAKFDLIEFAERLSRVVLCVVTIIIFYQVYFVVYPEIQWHSNIQILSKMSLCFGQSGTRL